MTIEAHDPHHQARGGPGQGKGLAGNSVGLLGGTVLGISSVAPAYALTATLGILVAEAGSKMAVVHHRRLPADVLRRVRLPRVQQGRAGLRDVVHLDHQGVRPLRRLAGRVGRGDGHGHRVVEPRGRRRPVLLPVRRRSDRQRIRRARCGRTAASTSSPVWSSWRSRPRSPIAASPRPNACSSSSSASRWWFCCCSRSSRCRNPAVLGNRYDVQPRLVQPRRPDDVGVHRGPVRLDLRVLGLGHRTDRQRGVHATRTRPGPGRAAVRRVDPAAPTCWSPSRPRCTPASAPKGSAWQRGDLRQRLRRTRRAGAWQPARHVPVPRRGRLQRREPDHDVPADLADHAGDGQSTRPSRRGSPPSTPGI